MNISQLRLLTRRNTKILKGMAQGFMSLILHLAPANLSGYEVCRHRTPQCTKLCLNTAGRGGIFKPGETTNVIQQARIRRTRELFENPVRFYWQLVQEIECAAAYATRQGYTPCFRLNGTSDIRFEQISVWRGETQYRNIFAAFPELQFYDYTKYPIGERDTAIPNYALTFSYAETLDSVRKAYAWLGRGHNVAAVFSDANFPETFLGHPTLDGDISDLRFLDARGHIVALKAKGRPARKHIGGFAVPTTQGKGASHVSDYV